MQNQNYQTPPMYQEPGARHSGITALSFKNAWNFQSV